MKEGVMRLDRLVASLRTAFRVVLLAAAVYVALAVALVALPGVESVRPAAIPWAQGLPAWPLFALLGVALAITVVNAALVLALRTRKRRVTGETSAAADAWLAGPEARSARETGSPLIKVGGFRAHARAPHGIELTWNPPLDGVDEVVVYRSPEGFATAPDPAAGQTLVCRAVEASHADAGLEDQRVYFYTAFARGRDGSWSPPSWAWAVTPSLPLHSTIMGGMRSLRQGVFDA
jgi:hypothetical protein